MWSNFALEKHFVRKTKIIHNPIIPIIEESD